MTLESIIKFRDEIAKDKPLRIVCDNEHIFYDNVKGHFPILWDDEAQTMTTIVYTTDVYSSHERPFIIATTGYDHIQFMDAIKTPKEIVQYISSIKDKLTEDQYNECMDLARPGAFAGRRSIRPATALPKTNPSDTL